MACPSFDNEIPFHKCVVGANCIRPSHEIRDDLLNNVYINYTFQHWIYIYHISKHLSHCEFEGRMQFAPTGALRIISTSDYKLLHCECEGHAMACPYKITQRNIITSRIPRANAIRPYTLHITRLHAP